MKPSLCVSLMAAVLCLAGGCKSVPRADPARTSLPAIARIAGIQIGYSTQEDLVKRWGKGKTIIGGHPNSGRIWRVKGTPWVVQTDGFDYRERGLVVDSLQIHEAADLPNDVPYLRLPHRDFVWLGGIAPGMSREQVMEILKRESLPVTTTTNSFEVEARGFVTLQSSIDPLRTWTASLQFTQGRLNRLTLGASE